MLTTNLTIATVINNIEKNGYPKGIGGTGYEHEGIFYACALGQASLNLGHKHGWLWDQLFNGGTYNTIVREFGQRAFQLNDSVFSRTLKEIAETLRIEYADQLDTVIPEYINEDDNE